MRCKLLLFCVVFVMILPLFSDFTSAGQCICDVNSLGYVDDGVGNCDPYLEAKIIEIDVQCREAVTGSQDLVVVLEGEAQKRDGSLWDGTGTPIYEWDFGDGTNGMGKRVEHTYANPDEYTVVLTVRVDTQKDSESEQVKVDSKPVIQGVDPVYKKVFIEKLTVNNEYKIFVHWRCLDPDKIKFNLNGNEIIEPAQEGGPVDPAASHIYNMGFDFRADGNGGNNELKIVAVGKDGDGNEVESEPTVLQPKVVEVPLWTGLLTSVELAAPTVTYKKDTSFELDAKTRVPNWVPVINGEMGVQKVKTTSSIKAVSDGSADIGMAGTVSFVAMSQEVGGSLEVSAKSIFDALELTGGSMKVTVFGTVEKTVGVIDAIPQLKALEGIWLVGRVVRWFNMRATIKGTLSPEVHASTTFKEADPGNLIDGWDISGGGGGSLPLLLTLSLRVIDGLEASVFGGGTPAIELQFPADPGYLKKFSTKLLVGVALKVWRFTRTVERSVEFCTPACTFDFHTISDWSTIPRDYATSSEYGSQTLESRQIQGLMSSFSSQSLVTEEETIISHIYPEANPDIATLNGQKLLVWVHDDISKPLFQGEEVYYSHFDGLSWSPQASITNNTNFEFRPKVIYDFNGNAIAVWEFHKNNSLNESTTLDGNFTSQLEIAYSTFDIVTLQWANPTLVTNNDYLDFAPRLVSDFDDNIALIWIANEDNAEENHSIYMSDWTGSAFSAPIAIRTSDELLQHDFAYNNGKIIYVWSEDLDGNSRTLGDEEIFASVWSGGSWGPDMQITNNSLDDEKPAVIINGDENPKVLWLRRTQRTTTEFDPLLNETIESTEFNNILYESMLINNSWVEPKLVRGNKSIYDFEVTLDANDNLALIWTQMTSNGSDMSYIVYDNNFSSWSDEKQLTNDFEMEEDFAPIFDASNRLFVSYIKTGVELANVTRRFNGTDVNISGIPQFTTRDLRVLRHNLFKELEIRNDDLVLSNLNPEPGETVIINATIHNIGDLTIDSVEVEFTDGLVNGTRIGEVQTIDMFNASTDVVVLVNWTVPDNSTHIISVKVDPLDEVPENDEANNEAFFSTVLPDLAVNGNNSIAIHPSNLLLSENEIIINTSISNKGVIPSQDIEVGFYYDLYNSTNVSNRVLIEIQRFSQLGANEEKIVMLAWDTSSISPEWYNVHVVVDPNGNIEESNESNNEEAILAEVVPDLAVDAYDIEFSSHAIGDIVVNFTISNLGHSEAKDVQVDIFNVSQGVTPFFVVEKNGTNLTMIDYSFLLFEETIDSIAPNERATFAKAWDDVIEGNYTFYVIIDANQSILEILESNNVAIAQATILDAPDLTVEQSDILLSNETAGEIGITANIRNIGSKDADNVLVQFFDGPPSDGVQMGDNESIALIQSGDSESASVNWIVPQNDSEDHIVYVVIDADNSIDEADEANNLGLRQLTSSQDLSQGIVSSFIEMPGECAANSPNDRDICPLNAHCEPVCFDGIRDFNEDCENNAECSQGEECINCMCTPVISCGNGVVEKDEECEADTDCPPLEQVDECVGFRLKTTTTSYSCSGDNCQCDQDVSVDTVCTALCGAECGSEVGSGCGADARCSNSACGTCIRDEPEPPTLITIASFSAHEDSDSRNIVEWETGSELDTLGFNIYGSADDIIYEKLNNQLILAEGDEFIGTSYMFEDYSGSEYYKLEDVEFDGASVMHDSVMKGEEKTPLVVGSEVEEAAFVEDAFSSGVVMERSNLRDSKYKIPIDEDGIYKVDYDFFQNNNIDVSNVNPGNLKIKLSGNEIPIKVEGEEDGVFDQEDYIMFYGVGNKGIYSNENVYWLYESSENGLRMETISEVFQGESVQDYFLDTHLEEENWKYWAKHGSDGNDHWYWKKIITFNESEEIFEFELSNVVSLDEDANLRMVLHGISEDEHNVEVYINNNSVGDVFWTGQEEYVIDAEFPQSYLNSDINTLKIKLVVKEEPDQKPGSVYLNNFEIAYLRNYNPENSELRFSIDSGKTVGIPLVQGALIFDITEFEFPKEINYLVEDNKIKFTNSDEEKKEYLLMNNPETPERIFIAEGTNLKELDGANYIVITHSDFSEQAHSLANYRKNEGYETLIVNVTDIYEEFGYGNFNPGAIRAFLSFGYYNWSIRPRYVVLLGDTTYDYKNFRRGKLNYVPTYLEEAEFVGETSSDNWFVSFEDDVTPKISIGRLPVNTPEEAENAIAKVISFSNASEFNSLAFVADNSKKFESTSNKLAEIVPEYYKKEKIFSFGLEHNETRALVIESINQGKMVVNYNGHGNMELLSRFFSASDVDSLNNYERYPFVIAMNCLSGFFQHPIKESIAERFLTAKGKGSAALFMSTGLSVPSKQEVFNEEIYNEIFVRNNTVIGSAIRESKISILNRSEAYSDIVKTYTLFGDPATRLNLFSGKECKTNCRDRFRTERKECKEMFGDERKGCINNVDVTRRECRMNAKENRKACRVDAKSEREICLASCGN